jgi:hypothetical protein
VGIATCHRQTPLEEEEPAVGPLALALLVLASAPPPGQTHAERLAWELESRRSVELWARVELNPVKIDPQTPLKYDAIEDHYVETAMGERLCDARFLKSGVAVQRYGHFSDGSKCADLNYSEGNLERQVSAVIKRTYFTEDRSDRTERPEPLSVLYVGREPLQKALPKARYLGKDRVVNRGCDVFLFVRVRWEIPQDHVYFLDEATSIPLKVESYADETARTKKNPLWTWTAQSLDEVGHHFVPLKSKTISYGENAQPDFTWVHTVVSIEFGKDFPASTFWPSLNPGVGVLDTIANKRYVVPGVREEPSTGTSDGGDDRTAVRAAAPSDWTGTISACALGLGAATLILGGVLWWRGRHSST